MGACVLMNVSWHVCTAHPVHDILAGQLIRPEQDMMLFIQQLLPGCSSKQMEQVCRACRKRSMRREASYCSRRRTTCSVLSLLPSPLRAQYSSREHGYNPQKQWQEIKPHY